VAFVGQEARQGKGLDGAGRDETLRESAPSTASDKPNAAKEREDSVFMRILKIAPAR
jgi:hypothetical protein